MLLLVATPIGHLDDFSFRAVEALKNADLIFCEDTRRSRILLDRYQIKKPLNSFHQYNEKQKIDSVICALNDGKTVCLISDAGTPLISDPGFPLVKACIEAGIFVTAIPGPCALIHALICSGLEWERFQFVGFLPKKEKELRAQLNEIIQYEGVTICYESPHRVLDTLNTLVSMAPSLQICLARELTKIHETYLRGRADQILMQASQELLRGECIILIKGSKPEADFSSMTLEEHVVEVQQKFQITKRDAIKIVADLRHINKRTLYRDLEK